MSSEIQAEIAQYLARYNFGIPPSPDDDIFQFGTVTSLVAMQLLRFVEKNWAIQIANNELKRDNFRTVAMISAMVGRHLAARSVVGAA